MDKLAIISGEDEDFVTRQLHALTSARRRARLSLIVSSITLLVLIGALCGAVVLWRWDYHVVQVVQAPASPPPRQGAPITHQWYSRSFKSGDASICVEGAAHILVTCDKWTELEGEQAQRSVADVLRPLQSISLVVLVGGHDVESLHSITREGIRTNIELAQARAALVRAQIEDVLKQQKKPIPPFITVARAAEETHKATDRDRSVDITLIEWSDRQ